MQHLSRLSFVYPQCSSFPSELLHGATIFEPIVFLVEPCVLGKGRPGILKEHGCYDYVQIKPLSCGKTGFFPWFFWASPQSVQLPNNLDLGSRPRQKRTRCGWLTWKLKQQLRMHVTYLCVNYDFACIVFVLVMELDRSPAVTSRHSKKAAWQEGWQLRMMAVFLLWFLGPPPPPSRHNNLQGSL